MLQNRAIKVTFFSFPPIGNTLVLTLSEADSRQEPITFTAQLCGVLGTAVSGISDWSDLKYSAGSAPASRCITGIYLTAALHSKPGDAGYCKPQVVLFLVSNPLLGTREENP